MLQGLYKSNYVFDHSIATVFGGLGYAMNQAITTRIFFFYSMLFVGNLMLEVIGIKTGKQLYDYEKYQYFNKLLLCVMMGVFTGTLLRRIQHGLQNKAIIPR